MPIANRIVAEKSWDYLDRLKSLGIKPLGRGSKGTVFQHPTMPNVAVKVYERDDWDKSVFWLRWCEKNQKNPYVPKIYRLGKLKNIELDVSETKQNINAYHVAFMEKLEKCPRPLVLETFTRTGALPDVINRVRTFWDFEDKPKWASITDKNLLQVLKKIKSLSGTDSNGSDLIDANIMRRGKQIVFSDPVY